MNKSVVDQIFADRLNHASLNDACVLSRATFRRFAHNDLAQLDRLLTDTPARTKLIAVDAVYSMEGDTAPLAALLALAERHGVWLYLDDAHGFGVLGEGRGSVVAAGLSSPQLIYMATLGNMANPDIAKALRRSMSYVSTVRRNYGELYKYDAHELGRIDDVRRALLNLEGVAA